MLGIPGPARVAAAAANFYDASVRGGLADLRRMPAALIDHGRLRSLYRYLPVEQAAPRENSDPILLVPPLAAPAFCFDLRRGCSLAEHLLLAALASHAGDRVDFLAWDRRLRGRVHGASGAELLARMVDSMADIEAELIEADWAAVPGQVRRVTSRHALVVLLTAADSPGTARGMLSVLPQLTARHTVIVASVADPDLVVRLRDGAPAESRCTHCNACVAEIERGPVRCLL